MKIFNTIRVPNNLFGGLSSIVDDKSKDEDKKENESKIAAKIKSLKDERNNHTQRVTEIDVEITRLEKELISLAGQDKTSPATT